MTLETNVTTEEQRQGSKGQNYGFIIAILFLVAASVLIGLGHDTAGTVLGTIDLVALVAVFVYGKIKQKDNS